MLISLRLRECKTSLTKRILPREVFPLRSHSQLFFVGGFVILARLNLTSLLCYSFPLTTVLRFNLRVALRFWLRRVFFILVKSRPAKTFLPANSPWYLARFLRVIELVRILVRPATLCLRLLANIRAGHILLSLVSKIGAGLWLLGLTLGLLELVVSLVQAFVFIMLTTVYLEEAIRH